MVSLGKLKEYIVFTVSNIVSRKKRSMLTIIAIVIGISAVVSLTSLGYGLQDTINEQFESMGTDKLMIMPGGSMFSMMGIGGGSMTKHDMDVVQRVNGIETAGAMIYKSAKVEFKGETKYTFVIGLPTDETRKVIDSMQQIKIIEGRDLKKTDNNAVMVGYLIINDEFFGKGISLGDKISIEGRDFKIIGALDRIGSRPDDTQVYIPLDTAREIFDEPEKIDIIIAKTRSGYDASVVAEDVKEALRKDRGVEKGEEDFTVQTSEQLLDTFSSIFSLVMMVVIGIAAISLLVGGVGIMNTMYMSILERTREIGVMKSIGAMNSDILLMFLIESGFLGLFGGIAGCLLGIGIAKLVEVIIQGQIIMLRASISTELIAGTLLFSFIIGTVSGLLPARRAARLQPVEALRYE
jgi:putative ABC transport system permease protein